MRSILALAKKDLTLLLRDKAGFFFVFFFPLIYAVFFGTIFSGEGGGMSALSVALVDEDGTDASRAFTEKLQAAPELKVDIASHEDAVSMVRKGQRAAYILLPAGFETARGRIMRGESLRIEVGLDPGRKAESGLLQGVVTQYAFQILQDLFQDREALKTQVRGAMDEFAADDELNPLTKLVLNRFFESMVTFFDELPANTDTADASGVAGVEDEDEGLLSGWQPVRVDFESVVRKKEGLPKSSYDITMPQAFVWVFLGCAAAFGVSLVTERTRGTMLRLRSAPITLGQILAGKALACFTMSMAALIVLFAFFYFVFSVRPNSYPMLIFAFVSSALAFVGVMMLIAVLGKTEAAAGGIGWALLLIMAMIGGGMIPLVMLPSWMGTVSHVSFVKWTVLAMEGAVWRGFSFAEMMLPCGILIAIGAVCFIVGVKLFKLTAE